MNDFLQDLLAKLCELTQKAQEFHRNVKGREYFCLHKSFNDDYDSFFALQDSIGELLVQKQGNANITYKHEPTNVGISCDEMVKEYLTSLEEVCDMVEGQLERDIAFSDKDALNDILEYADKKIMMYKAFLKK